MLVKQQDSQEESKWVQQASFTEITAWKHGVGPVRTDSAQKRLDYLKICQQVISSSCFSLVTWTQHANADMRDLRCLPQPRQRT